MKDLMAVLVLLGATVASQAGEIGKVTVTADQAPILQGKETVLTAKKGDTFDVSEVKGDWYGVLPSRGWIHKGNVQFEPAMPPGPPPPNSAGPTWARIILDEDFFPAGRCWAALDAVWRRSKVNPAAPDQPEALNMILVEPDFLRLARVAPDRLAARYGKPEAVEGETSALDRGVTWHVYGPIAFGFMNDPGLYTHFRTTGRLYAEGFRSSAQKALKATQSPQPAAAAVTVPLSPQTASVSPPFPPAPANAAGINKAAPPTDSAMQDAWKSKVDKLVAYANRKESEKDRRPDGTDNIIEAGFGALAKVDPAGHKTFEEFLPWLGPPQRLDVLGSIAVVMPRLVLVYPFVEGRNPRFRDGTLSSALAAIDPKCLENVRACVARKDSQHDAQLKAVTGLLVFATLFLADDGTVNVAAFRQTVLSVGPKRQEALTTAFSLDGVEAYSVLIRGASRFVRRNGEFDDPSFAKALAEITLDRLQEVKNRLVNKNAETAVDILLRPLDSSPYRDEPPEQKAPAPTGKPSEPKPVEPSVKILPDKPSGWPASVKSEREMFIKRLEIPREEFGAWLSGLTSATGTAIRSKDLFVSLPYFDFLYAGEVFQKSASQKYLQRVRVVPTQSIGDWFVAMRQFTEETELGLANTLLTLVQIDQLFVDGQFNRGKSEELIARAKTLNRTSVRKLAEALGQKNMREVVARIVVLDAFFKNGVFQQDAFEQQLDQEVKSRPKKAE